MFVLPVGEETDAVATRHNCFKGGFQLIQRKVLVDILPHIKGWLNVNRDFGYNSKRAQADDGPGKLVAIFFTGENANLAVGRNELQGGNSR